MLLMEEISLQSVKTAVEWIFEANFTEERPEMLNLIVTSPGGDLNAAFALIDVMRGSAIPIRTIGLGQIASAGLMIFIAGDKGMRILTPNTSILSHQYSWGAIGKEHELFATVKEFDLTTKKMIQHYKKSTGLSEAKIREVLLPPQDVWLSPQEAKKLGLCDDVKDLA
jgi:ATP-dependent Clp protease protease subunit